MLMNDKVNEHETRIVEFRKIVEEINLQLMKIDQEKRDFQKSGSLNKSLNKSLNNDNN